MTDKKSKSNMPSDDFTMTDGYNYGLDGFQFDTEYGSGVLDNARLPEVHGLADLPDGLVVDAVPEGDVDSQSASHQIGDLDQLMKEGSLAGLGWLHGEQDPDRLPVNPVDKGIEELEQAWGVEHRTDGVNQRLPYKESHASTPTAKKASTEDLLRVVQRAMRKSAYGYPIAEIIKEAREELGPDFPRIAQTMRRLVNEHGLAGKVFIRAAAFPGLKNGKWKEIIRKKCGSAKYIIAEEGSPVGGVVGKEAVVVMPWDEAMAHYGPKLQSLGYVLTEDGDLAPPEILKKAFLAGPGESAAKDSFKPVEVKAVDTVTSEEAQKQFAAATPEPRQQVSVGQRVIKGQRKKAHGWIAQKMRAGLLSQEAAKRLFQSTAPPADVLKAATKLVAATAPSKEYDGIGVSFIAAAPDERETRNAWELLSRAESKTAMETQEMWAAQNKQAREYLEKKYVSAGVLSATEVNRIFSLGKSPREAMVLALTAVRKKGVQATETKEYVGGNYKANAYRSPKGAAIKQNSEFLDWYHKQSQAVKRLLTESIESNGVMITPELRKQLYKEGGRSPAAVVDEALKLGRQVVASLKNAAQTEDYKGHRFEAAVPQRKQVAAKKTASVQEVSEWINAQPKKLRASLLWVAKAMNEGSAGKDLDDLIKMRLTSDVRLAAQEAISTLRKAHEGAAGFLYVDPHVYASKTGTKGCDKGASKHRVNGIPMLLEMERCHACKFANAKLITGADDQPIEAQVCQKYNKTLIAAESGDGAAIEKVKQANIKAAGAGDAEMTASLFAPAHDPAEFDLGSATDNIKLSDDPDFGDIGDIFFGGGFEI